MAKAAIYARISLDRNGEADGVERQVADAMTLAEARGFDVVDQYIDNDRSAYSGRTRPEWSRLLQDLQDGKVGHVVAWTSDRLYRRTRDQLELMEAVRLAGGTIVTVKEGDVDPGSAEGRMRMGILANVAEFESARKAERVARAAEERAAAGRPHGRPPFGWKLGPAGEWVLDRDQAGMIREAAARLLRGESCGSIVADWNAQGLPTAAGAGRWKHQSLRKIMRRPTNAALRVHQGKVVGDAEWPPILDLETHEAVVARLRGRYGQRRPRRYLLTTIVTCADDGARMSGAHAKARGYCCVECGRRIDAGHLDELVTEAVLQVLDTPRLTERLARARADSAEADALQELDRAGRRLTEIGHLFGSGEMDLAAYRAAQAAAQDRYDDAERALSRRRSSVALAEAASSPDGIRAVWERQGMAWRREVIRAVVESIEIGPSTRPAWEPERAKITWRSA